MHGHHADPMSYGIKPHLVYRMAAQLHFACMNMLTTSHNHGFEVSMTELSVACNSTCSQTRMSLWLRGHRFLVVTVQAQHAGAPKQEHEHMVCFPFDHVLACTLSAAWRVPASSFASSLGRWYLSNCLAADVVAVTYRYYSGLQVPRSKSVKPHPVGGLARINLTFRRLDPQSAARAPSCKCGQKAVLKVLSSPLHATCLQAFCIGMSEPTPANKVQVLVSKNVPTAPASCLRAALQSS